MANRRMFSLKVVDTDAFLDMPLSTQALYFHLAMRADDDGFVSNPKRICRTIGVQGDDMKVLISKKFIIPFESGVCVIKHWRIHNYIQNDRKENTQWIRELSQLKVDPESKKYSLVEGKNKEWIQNGYNLEPQDRLGKDRLGKDRLELAEQSSAVSERADKHIIEIIDAFREFNSAARKWYANKTEREAADNLCKFYGKEKVLKMIGQLPNIIKRKFSPKVSKLSQLEDKWTVLEGFMYSEVQGLQANSVIDATKKKYEKNQIDGK